MDINIPERHRSKEILKSEEEPISEGQKALETTAKQKALSRFPNNERGRELTEKEVLGTLDRDEKDELAAITRFPSSVRGQELALKEIQGTLDRKERVELGLFTKFPNSARARELTEKEDLNMITKKEKDELESIVRKIKLDELREGRN